MSLLGLAVTGAVAMVVGVRRMMLVAKEEGDLQEM